MDDGQSRWQLESQERCRVILDDIGLLCIGLGMFGIGLGVGLGLGLLGIIGRVYYWDSW